MAFLVGSALTIPVGAFAGVHVAGRAVHAPQGKRPSPPRRSVGKAPPAGVVERSAVPKPVEVAPPAPAKEASAATAPRGPTRIDFDDRLIQGQSNKSGAVYLFDRKESALRSMVHRRTSFRDEIVKDVLD
jgi:hypothetical protein